MWSSSRNHLATRRSLLGAAGLLALAQALVLLGSCAQVHVEETKVAWTTPVCGGNGGGRNGAGGGTSPPQMSPGVMDTYMVQIFELNDPNGANSRECETCIATRENCFIERSSCVCGEATAPDPSKLQEMLKGVRVGLPATYPSLYCMRVMAVQRTSPSESVNCECDATWEQPDRVRLCALSDPYAAGALPIQMDVQCSLNTDRFSTCLGQ